MGIRKRGDKWLVTVESGLDELGVRRRICRAVDSEETAKRLLAKLQHEVYEGRHVQPSHETVPNFCLRYLEHHRPSVAPSTYLRQKSIIETHIVKPLRAVTLARFKPSVAVKWRETLFAAGLAPATVRKYCLFMSAAMDLAVRWELIAKNPMDGVELPSESAPPFHVYSAAEQAALLCAAAPSEGAKDGYHAGRSEGSLYVPLVTDLASGLRRGELLGLRVTDVDLASKRIHVRQALRKRSDGRYELGPCKTARSRRTIVLSESIADLLAKHISTRPDVRSDLLYLSLNGKPWTLDGFESSWRKVRSRAAAIMRADAKKLGDPHWEAAGDGIITGRFHDLRHTHATELLRAGVHIKVVAERLGDSELTVMRTYSHVLPDMQEAAAAAIEPMMRGLLPQVQR